MKVKAILKYYDKEEKRVVEAGEIIEVKTEERLNELLGNNQKKIVCCERLQENEETKVGSPKEAEKKQEKGKKINAKRR